MSTRANYFFDAPAFGPESNRTVNGYAYARHSPHLPDLPNAAECIFCKIAQGNMPCAKVYESDNVLAFLDINPFKFGHTLIIPKEHYPTLLDFPAALGTEMFHVMQAVGAGVLKHTQAQGLNCMQNNFQAAGQVIFHIHWHLIPRHIEDGLFENCIKHQSYSGDAMRELAKAIEETARAAL